MSTAALTPAGAAVGGTLPLADPPFGPTFQGEGPSAGRVAVFVRLGGCNLSCTWCDAPYSWDRRRYDLREQIRQIPVADVVDFLATAAARLDRPLLVVTGGEPLLHQHRPAFRGLLAAADDLGLDVEIETNATRIPVLDLPGAVTFNASPKLGHAGDPVDRRINPGALAVLAALARRDRARFKFVATGPVDLDEIAGLVETHQLPARQVWIMPEGASAAAVLATARNLAGPVLHRGWCLTLRTHTLLWNDERGR
jgi:organic radical activating enzyme